MTDIGIELGRMASGFGAPQPSRLPRLRLLCMLVLFFFVGGVAGALGFKHVGYAATIPLAMVLVLLASVPIVDDLNLIWGRKRGD